MTDQLPPPATVDQLYLAAILAKLQTTNDLLHALIVQGKPAEPPAGEVVLREPKRKRSE